MNPAVVRAAQPTAYIVVAIGDETDPALPNEVEDLRTLIETTGVKAHVVSDPTTRYGITKQLIDDLGLGEVAS